MIGMEKTTRTIKQKRIIPAKPAEVYDALMNAERHTEFTGSKATWDGYISGKNLALKKGRRIVQEWTTTEWPTGYPPSIVEFSFRAKEGATELTMVHSKVPAEQAESYRQGWIDFYWKPMKQYFQRKMHS
jgi:uncharacterized protein YndB with AHSA1/START domain